MHQSLAQDEVLNVRFVLSFFPLPLFRPFSPSFPYSPLSFPFTAGPPKTPTRPPPEPKRNVSSNSANKESRKPSTPSSSSA
jgi:hypothetical protein